MSKLDPEVVQSWLKAIEKILLEALVENKEVLLDVQVGTTGDQSRPFEEYYASEPTGSLKIIIEVNPG